MVKAECNWRDDDSMHLSEEQAQVGETKKYDQPLSKNDGLAIETEPIEEYQEDVLTRDKEQGDGIRHEIPFQEHNLMGNPPDNVTDIPNQIPTDAILEHR